MKETCFISTEEEQSFSSKYGDDAATAVNNLYWRRKRDCINKPESLLSSDQALEILKKAKKGSYAGSLREKLESESIVIVI